MSDYEKELLKEISFEANTILIADNLGKEAQNRVTKRSAERIVEIAKLLIVEKPEQ